MSSRLVDHEGSDKMRLLRRIWTVLRTRAVYTPIKKDRGGSGSYFEKEQAGEEMGWCYSLLKVLLYTSATLGYVMKKLNSKKLWFIHNLWGSFLPTSILNVREKRRQRMRISSMRSTFLTKQILKQNCASLKKERKRSRFLRVIFLHYFV